MDAATIPRLRVQRDFQSTAYDYSGSVAGPSRFPGNASDVPHDSQDNMTDDNDDDTPKLYASTKLPSTSFSESAEETPAARLKAVLSRVSNSSSRSKAPESATPSSASTVDLESEFDIPEIGSSMPSLARESLKDLFSRALREPGDTPQKMSRTRPRRNSIDTSEFESSPRVEKIQRERSIAKGKQKSFSDDETENSISNHSKTSAASMFDSLRERLSSSSQRTKSEFQPFPKHDGDTSADTITFPVDLDSSRATPPVATSTPLHSLRISLNSRFESNLMEQDSEMREAMAGADSFEFSQEPKIPVYLPPRNGRGDHSVDKNANLRQQSHANDFRSQSISGSSSHSSHHHHGHLHTHSDVISTDTHVREHDWNKHHPVVRSNTPDVSHRRHSPGQPMSPTTDTGSRTLSRKSSSASLLSIESGRSSRAESIKYRPEHETDRNHDLERSWNKPRPRTVSRPSSAIGLPDPSPRSRTHSVTSRPDSRLSTHSPRLIHSRHNSHSSNSSRASSPNGSFRSSGGEKEIEEEFKAEVNHERERNWNSPHPVWYTHTSIHGPPSRSSSPLPPSPSPVPSSPGHIRTRAESLRSLKSPSFHASRDTPTKSPGGRSLSFTRPTLSSESKISPHSVRFRRTSSTSLRVEDLSDRPSSPLPSIKDKLKKAEKSLPFPQSQIPSATSVNDSKKSVSPRHSRTLSSPSPSPRPSSRRNPESSRASHIPVWTPSKPSKILFPSSPSKDPPERGPSARDIPSVVLNEPAEGRDSKDELTETDKEEDGMAIEKTPTLRAALSLPSESSSPVRTSSIEERRLSKLITSPPSPPPSPPSEDPSMPSTPPHRTSFNTSKVEFQTPSPPKGGLPDLPGPPSESSENSEDVTDDITPVHMNGNLSNMKTPKPPGGWFTPAPSRQNGLLRAQSLPEEETTTESGLATPVASLSRSHSVPPQTPALPGAWMATPYRKSVRFDQQDTSMETETSTAETTSDSRGEYNPLTPEPDSEDETPVMPVQAIETGLKVTASVATKVEDVAPSPVTPPDSTPSTQLRNSRKEKSIIRMVDEFGRERPVGELMEEKKHFPRESPRKNRNTIRLVDSMGHAINESTSMEQSSELENIPLTRTQALERVRKGLSDLAQGFDIQESNNAQDHHDRVKKLNDVSQTAREKRERLAQGLLVAEAEMKSKLAASRVKSTYSVPLSYRAHGFLRSWIFWGIVQVVIIIVMLKKADTEAKRLYLTRYYDPFYSDLYVLPDAQSCSSLSVIETLWQRGFLATIGNILHCWSGWDVSDDAAVRSGFSWPLT
ncbi:hypothetical protein K435DRAFT_743345 [Dendrothele bispora CBS 962.96]|uniref:Uncharacterized protein n=1 Tax=Dendrothele bispora (strain CBS 962.96) TaxID=1314807 RepID=A0A4S8MU51_DENBC|nr:hypothetical protein K435DRAFT_743345 [Dendrothele bispora CBS 962.96]